MENGISIYAGLNSRIEFSAEQSFSFFARRFFLFSKSKEMPFKNKITNLSKNNYSIAPRK